MTPVANEYRGGILVAVDSRRRSSLEDVPQGIEALGAGEHEAILPEARTHPIAPAVADLPREVAELVVLRAARVSALRAVLAAFLVVAVVYYLIVMALVAVGKRLERRLRES